LSSFWFAAVIVAVAGVRTEKLDSNEKWKNRRQTDKEGKTKRRTGEEIEKRDMRKSEENTIFTKPNPVQGTKRWAEM